MDGTAEARLREIHSGARLTEVACVVLGCNEFTRNSDCHCDKHRSEAALVQSKIETETISDVMAANEFEQAIVLGARSSCPVLQSIAVAGAKGDWQTAREQLLNDRLDVNAIVTATSSTALSMAAEFGFHHIVRVLLSKGSVVDGVPPMSPLVLAVQRGQIDSVEVLLQGRATVDVRAADGSTPLFNSCWHGYLDIATMLVQSKADVNVRVSSNGATPIHCATQKGDAELVKLLLDGHSDANAAMTDGSGTVPIHIGAMFGLTEVLVMLLNSRANACARGATGATALHSAAENGSAQLLQILVDNQADLEARTHKGITPLMVATVFQQVEVLRLLVRLRVELDAQMPSNGATALHNAAQFGKSEAIQMLLNAKANAALEDSQGNAAADIAQREGHTKAAELLLAAQPFPRAPRLHPDRGRSAQYAVS